MVKHLLVNLLLFCGLLLLLMACNKEKKQDINGGSNTLPYYNDANFTPIWLESTSDSVKGIHKIAPFSLINQDGKKLTERDFDGKIYVTNFFFTICPNVCPKMTANLAEIQKAFLDDDEILLLSHSVTPERDSVAALKKYAFEKDVISNKWHLATGNRNEIYNLGRNEYFIEEDLGVQKDEDEFLHTENFVLVDKNKHIRGIYNGLNKVAVEQLIKDIKILKVEK